MTFLNSFYLGNSSLYSKKGEIFFFSLQLNYFLYMIMNAFLPYLSFYFLKSRYLIHDSFAKVALGRRLGIEEPQLMRIIRATLHTHSEWFKLQMCKDQFEGLLWINSLKEIGSPSIGDAASRSTIDTCTQGSSPATVSSANMKMHEDGSSPNQISSTDIGCDENAILKVMVSPSQFFCLDVVENKVLNRIRS